MKFLPIIFLLLGIECFCQSDTSGIGKENKWPISYDSVCLFDFENAIKLDYNSLTADKLFQSIPRLFQKELLCGAWQAEGMGNSWGDYRQTIVKPNKRIVFQADNIFFYRNDTLVRTTVFRIIQPVAGSIQYRLPLIEFLDSKEQWQIILHYPGELVPWHGRAKKLYLYFNRQPNCICGCPEELYSEEVSSKGLNY